MPESDKTGGGTPVRRSRKRDGPGFDIPTPNDNMLYLVLELERSIQMPTVIWSPALASSVLLRLETVVETVRRIGQLQS